MKRMGQFLIAFVVLLILAYFQPVFFPQAVKTAAPATSVNKTKHKASAYQKIETTGLATFIGKSGQDLVLSFGEPKEKRTSTLGYEWWLYFAEDQLIFQAAVKENQVKSIFRIDNVKDVISSLEIGMKLKDLTTVTPISSDFHLTYQDRPYTFELSEKEMRNQPLVAFDNNSFALLYFDHSKDSLLAVRYVDMQTLLEIMPYHLVEGEALPLTINEPEDWAKANLENNQMFLFIVNSIRQRQKLDPLKVNDQANSALEKIMVQFVMEPERVIKDDEHLQQWQIHLEDSYFTAPFRLNENESERLLRKYPLADKVIKTSFLSPALDIPWAVMNSYDKIKETVRSNDELRLEIVVCYQRDNLLYLLQEASPAEPSKTVETNSTAASQ